MFRLPRRCRTRLFDMFWNRINQVNLISESCKPASVDSGTSAGVDDGGGSGRQVPEDQLPGTFLLKLKPA